MSGDNRTEAPTPKRRGKARAEGQVARSGEINSSLVLIATLAVLVITGPSMLSKLEALVGEGLARAFVPGNATAGGLGASFRWGATAFVRIVAPIAATALVVGVLANVAQVRFRFTTALIKPKFSKLDPLKGMKRLVSPSSLVELVKALAKTTLIGGVAYSALRPKLNEFSLLAGTPPAALPGLIGSTVSGIAFRVAGALVILAAADYAWQRHRHEKSLKMTKEEVKQEARQTDVAPEVKGAIRRRQVEQARRRMLSEVPTADVVVVNPTHFAVALRYDGTTPAPEVVAKGMDLVAAAIRRAAEEAGIPIISQPPLARALYREVDLGRQIPEELFAAVAEVLAFVFRTAGQRSRERRRRQRALAPG